MFGVKRPAAAEMAILLAGAGEFAFVVLTLARDAGLFAPSAHEFFVAVAALALLATPLLAWGGRRLAGRVERVASTNDHGPDSKAAEYADHVVIGGFGRVGRLIADVLDAERIPYVALDLDADLVASERSAGRPIYYGDATRREILDRVGAEHARAFVVTTDAAEAEEQMVKAIREAWPGAIIHARAKDQTHAAKLMEAGAISAVPEALEASLQLAAQILAAEGVKEAAIANRLARQRRAEMMQRTHKAGNARARPSGR
jgi:CPA2 family monovalent cation:H+ antiporter-2